MFGSARELQLFLTLAATFCVSHQECVSDSGCSSFSTALGNVGVLCLVLLTFCICFFNMCVLSSM